MKMKRDYKINENFVLFRDFPLFRNPSSFLNWSSSHEIIRTIAKIRRCVTDFPADGRADSDWFHHSFFTKYRGQIIRSALVSRLSGLRRIHRISLRNSPSFRRGEKDRRKSAE